MELPWLQGKYYELLLLKAELNSTTIYLQETFKKAMIKQT